ncbi:unnamed protein product [Ixodes hexagonus]
MSGTKRKQYLEPGNEFVLPKATTWRKQMKKNNKETADQADEPNTSSHSQVPETPNQAPLLEPSSASQEPGTSSQAPLQSQETEYISTQPDDPVDNPNDSSSSESSDDLDSEESSEDDTFYDASDEQPFSGMGGSMPSNEERVCSGE